MSHRNREVGFLSRDICKTNRSLDLEHSLKCWHTYSLWTKTRYILRYYYWVLGTQMWYRVPMYHRIFLASQDQNVLFLATVFLTYNT